MLWKYTYQLGIPNAYNLASKPNSIVEGLNSEKGTREVGEPYRITTVRIVPAANAIQKQKVCARCVGTPALSTPSSTPKTYTI